MQKSNTEQTVFIITGMHRSGTSLTASILQSAGVHIGRNLLGADQVNIKGHFENLDFYHLHMNILDSQGVSSAGWTLQDHLEIQEEFVDQAKEIIEQNALSSIWGWKEPRTTLFLEFWAKLLPEAKFLLIYRSPWEVVDSLYRRGDEVFQNQPELAVKYWQHYNQKILNFYNQEQHRCLLANVTTIIQDQAAYIDTINSKFNVDLSHPSPTAYDPTLLKNDISSNSQRPTLIDYYFPETIELYQELESRGWHPEQTPDFSWQELLKPSLYKTWAFQEWANLRRLEKENKALKIQLQEEQTELGKAESIELELEQTKTQLKTVESLLDQSQSQLHETETVLAQSQTKLKETETALTQSQTKLKETETVLAQSQTQLNKTETVLQQSHTQLNQNRHELAEVKKELSQAQFDVMRYQSQLHQTQEELESYEIQRPDWEKVQSQFYEAEVSLSQFKMQLQQTRKQEERLQIQLHQTLKQLEQKTTQLQQDQDALKQATDQVKQLKRDLKRSNSQLYQVQSEFDQSHSQLEEFSLQLHQTLKQLEQKTTQLQQDQDALKQATDQVKQLKRDLKRSNSQLYQVQSEFDQSHSQLEEFSLQLQQNQTELIEIQTEFQQTKLDLEQQKTYINELETSVSKLQQTQAELTQIQTEFQQTKLDLKQKKAQVYQLQTDLKRSQSQLYELQVELAQSQLQIQQIQERQRLEQTLADDPQKHSEIDYNLLIWDAWNAYRNGKLPQMKSHLQKALKLTKSSPSETMLTWLESFSKLSLAQGIELDTPSLTNSEEWQQLMRQMTAKKGIPLNSFKHSENPNQTLDQSSDELQSGLTPTTEEITPASESI